MEIKVDVHTVHPASPSPKEKSKTPLARGTYGSWCTPDSTPTHNALSQTNSNFQGKEEVRRSKYTKKLLPNKIRLFSTSPPPDYQSDYEIREADTELKDLKKSYSTAGSHGRRSLPGDRPPPVQTPKRRVSISENLHKKFKSFLRVYPICDPFVPIDPQGRGYISWLMLVTFCYSYNAWCIALRATFPYQTPQNTPLWMTADYLCDLIYVLDVALVKPRLMFVQDGFWVDGHEETKKNYRKKSQFRFDVISLLPLDILYVFFGTDKVILRLPRILKLQTFWEFHQAMDRVLSSPYVVRICKTLFYIFHLIHLNACAYYAMSVHIGLGSNGWVYDNQGNAYIRCFYFATKTATSIGKNPKPETTIEHLFMTAAWLMGVFVFALLIGQIRDIISAATRSRAEYRKTLDRSTRFLRTLNMPATLQRRVACWYNYTWNKQRCFDESKILNSLPFNMKRDVALEVHMSTLSKVQLFRDCSSSLLRDLVLQMRPVSFLPGDVVVRRGDVGHQMYIIKAGECCVMSEDEKIVLAKLTEGSVFGDISLLGIDGLRRRTATVRSRGYSSLFALSRHDLDAALKHHKEAAEILRLRADQIIRENAARRASERIMKAEAIRSISIHEEGKVRRRLSVASSASSAEARRQQSASAMSRRRLSAVSEHKQAVKYSPPPSCSRARTPLPTIVLSGD